MIIPVFIFFLGWLKLPLGILFSAILLFGFIWHIKHSYRTDESSLEIKVGVFVIVTALVLGWVFISGIGGITFQRWDFHYRNAVFRDLISFSWPVVYPETGGCLVYYFMHWLVPALIGKLFGYNAGNFALYLWSSFGIFISIMLLIKLLKVNSLHKILTLCMLFFFFGFPYQVFRFSLGPRWADFVPYRYTYHTEGIFWIFNQIIVPFIAVSLFLNEKKVSALALTGLCVLPFAPFPFCGIFLLFVLWGFAQAISSIKSNNFRQFVLEVLSVPNLSAIFSILIVFAFFFACNTASNGTTGQGGISLNVSEYAFTEKKRFLLLLFLAYFCNFGLFSILIFNENKRTPLFYIAIISLMFLPFIRIGTSNDFCWRSTIPAMFIFFVMIASTVLKDTGVSNLRRYCLGYVVLSSAFNCGFTDFSYTVRLLRQSHFTPILADSVYTFSDKSLEGSVFYLNYIDMKSKSQFFYKLLAKSKIEKTIQQDMRKTRQLQDERNLSLIEGRYHLSPKADNSLWLGLGDDSNIPGYEQGKTLCLTSMERPVLLTLCVCDWEERDKKFNDIDKSQILFLSEKNEWTYRLDIPFGNVKKNGGIGAYPPNLSACQRFKIVKDGTFYKILWGDYALTYNEKGDISMCPRDESEMQLWSFNRL